MFSSFKDSLAKRKKNSDRISNTLPNLYNKRRQNYNQIEAINYKAENINKYVHKFCSQQNQETKITKATEIQN